MQKNVETPDVHYENGGIFYDAKIYIRLFRRKIKEYLREHVSKRFTNVIYLSSDCPKYTPGSTRLDSPVYFINEMRNQYPNTEICLLIPVMGLESDTKPTRKIFYEIDGVHKVLERTPVHFDYFIKNQEYDAVLYKFLNNYSNVKVYGIFSPAFSYLQKADEITKFENTAAYLRAARIAVKKINKTLFPVDIVHSENLPFFLGAEFEPPFPASIKVLQIAEDFGLQDNKKLEPFFTVINLADESAIKRICSDNYVKNCICELFNTSIAKISGKMRECLGVINKNYKNFQNYVDSNNSIKGRVFSSLDGRILKLFPQVFAPKEHVCYPMLNTLKFADIAAVTSETYFGTMFENPNMPESFVDVLNRYKEKFTCLSLGFDKTGYKTAEGRTVYNNYDSENFRDERKENKILLLKEFSSERLDTNFIDHGLFKNSEFDNDTKTEDPETDLTLNGEISFKTKNITGYLDSFYDAPLLFAHLKPDIFAQGVDILFGSVLKMFEINKNIQVIICIPGGIKNKFIKSRIEFLQKYPDFNGRWVFINEEINLPKFYAGADMFIMPHRMDSAGTEHLLGMNLGCVPVVSRTGRLNDSVVDILDDILTCNGFKTRDSLWGEDCTEQYFNTLSKAIDMYKNNPSGWNVVIKNGITRNFGYNFEALEKYNIIYQELL